MDGKADAKIKGPDGKVLKKKTLSGKAKVIDDIGDEWEEIRTRKTVLVEENSESDD
jgi:hypothetical protein